MPQLQRALPEGGAEDAARLGRELSRLDPWSYWVVPLPRERVGDFLVVGTTGAFLVAVCGSEGRVSGNGSRVKVGRRPVRGLSRVRRAARRLRGRLAQVAVYTEVEPVVCLTRAVAGAPRRVRDVLVVGLPDLVREITGRPKALVPSRARRAAESLGPGNPRRHRPAEGPG